MKTSHPTMPVTLMLNTTLSIRKQIIETLHATGGGHYGGALSVVDILFVLYERITQIQPKSKDRIILSKGHAAVALYSVLAHFGIIDPRNLKDYGKFQRNLEGHPDMLVTPGVHFSSGSLGQGLSVGLGMAMGLNKKDHVWVVLGDGECQEGQIWEAALLAARYGVQNLHAFIDANNAQEFGYKHKPHLIQEPIPYIEDKWKAFGWSTHVVEEDNLPNLRASIDQLQSVESRPSVMIVKTKKGQGIELFENNPEKYHCANLTDDEYAYVLGEIGEKWSS